MNNLFSKYSKRFMGLAMASLVFSACEKEEFSEADALDLELQRLRLQDSIATAKDKLDNDQALGMAMYQRTLDSLDRVNSGGLVYYSVIPVRGTNAVFAAGGRTEEIQGEEGVEVTIAQYGRVITAKDGEATTDAGTIVGGANLDGVTAKNGVYTFPMLRSGEVGVTIKGDGLSTVNYIANLTPDGAVANGQVVYVSNVIPVFETSDDAAKMATVKGKAWYEQDLTNGVEEAITSDMEVSFTANIDVEAGGRGSKFWDRYMKEGNDEGFGISNDTDGNNGTNYITNNTNQTKSGYIQRYAYELDQLPRSVAGANGDGEYSLLVPSTSIGLPIKLEFSEFATDRTFYRNGKKVSTRHVYAPDVPADEVENGVKLPEFVFKAYETEATGTATYTKATTNGELDKKKYGVSANYFLLSGNLTKNTSSLLPTFAVKEGSGTGAAIAVSTSTSADSASLKTVADVANNSFTKGVGTQFMSVEVTNGGSGFTIADDDGKTDDTDVYIEVTRKDILTVGAANVQAAATGAISEVVYITNSGYGFISVANTQSGNTTATTGQFTNYPPQAVFSDAPVGGSTAQGKVVVDGTLGIVSFIEVTNAGRGYISTPTVSIVHGEAGSYDYEANAAEAANVNSTGVSAREPFLVNLGTGALAFNTAYFAGATGLTATDFGSLTFASTTGSNKGAKFTFIPSVTPVVGGTSSTSVTITSQAQITPSVNIHPADGAFGKIQQIRIASGGAYNIAALTAASNNVLFMSAAGATSNSDLNNIYIPFSSAVYNTGANASTLQMKMQITPDQTTRATALVSDQTTGAFLSNYTLDQTVSITGLDISTADGADTQYLTGARDYPGASDVAKFITTGAYVGTGFVDNSVNPAGAATPDLPNSSVLNLLANAPFLFVIDKTTASTPSQYAWGIPDFSVSNPGSTSTAVNRKVQGLRFVDMGSGYVGGQNYPVKIVPNLYKDASSYMGNGGNWSNVKWPSKNDLLSEFPTVKVDVTVNRTNAKLTLNITNAGKGYSRQPSLVVFGSGVDFAGMFITANSQGLQSLVQLNKDGGVEIIDKNKNGVTTDDNSIAVNTTNGETEWDRYLGTATSGDFEVSFIDPYTEELNVAFNSVTGRTSDKPTGMLWVNENGGLELDTDKNITINGKTARGWEFIPPVTHNNKPVVSEIKSDLGTGATAETEIVLTDGKYINNAANTAASTIAWRVKVSMTANGSEYARGNRYYNWGDGDDHEADNNNKGQDFRIIGGFNGGTTDNVANETNVRFDAFTGITYVRDVHYGTGAEVE